MTLQVYVSDTNIWIDFGHAGLLAALFKLPIALCSTDFVLDELQLTERQTLIDLGLTVVTLESDDIPSLFNLRQAHNNSSLADVSSYFVALRDSRPLLTGDARLRRRAQQDGLQVHGALWLLDELVRHDVVTAAQASSALLSMLKRGARLPDGDCQDRLRRWRA